VGSRDLWVVPISSFSTLGWRLPLGGNFLRQFPRPLVHHELRRWTSRPGVPLVTYFNVWELDPDQPRIAAAPLLQRVRQYRNLDRMYALLHDVLSTYRFTTIAERLGFGAEIASAPATTAAPRAPVARTPVPWRATPATPVTVVVPCFNEANGLQYLRNTLASVERTLASRYELRFIFVDDRSTDATFEGLHHVFGDHPRARVLRHEENAGVAAAIMTGLCAADTEIVCSIDADCTYDPHELAAMIPLLEQGADLVTASPYHPRGHVRNVPGWRLALSKGLSGLYRRILHNRLHTYTACFRVYRRSRAIGVVLTRRGFLGVMEHLGRLDLGGARITEHPTTLEVRMLGRSKMKVLRTIAGHLGLFAELAQLRFSRPPAAPPPAVAGPPPTPAVHG
jgi:hypothetical protein